MRPLRSAWPVLKEVRFEYRHDSCWLQDTTQRHPGLTLVATSIYLSGDDVVLLVTVHGDEAAVAQAAAEWEADPRLHRVQRLHAGARGSRFHIAYARQDSIYPRIIEHTPVSLGAIRFSGGREYYQVLGAPADVSALMRDLGARGELRVLSVREASVPDASEPAVGEPAQDAWSGLTDKQVEALVAAHRAGYYDWPRRCSATQLAKGLGLSSSAFLDHLRTAEARIIDRQVQALLAREPERRSAGAAARGRSTPP